jgi:hypothetical protein
MAEIHWAVNGQAYSATTNTVCSTKRATKITEAHDNMPLQFTSSQRALQRLILILLSTYFNVQKLSFHKISPIG